MLVFKEVHVRPKWMIPYRYSYEYVNILSHLSFQSESTPCSCPDGIQTHNHLVCKQTFKHLAKLAIWLSFAVSTYLYRATDCMLLSCYVHDHLVRQQTLNHLAKVARRLSFALSTYLYDAFDSMLLSYHVGFWE